MFFCGYYLFSARIEFFFFFFVFFLTLLIGILLPYLSGYNETQNMTYGSSVRTPATAIL